MSRGGMMVVPTGSSRCLGYQQITSLSSSTALTVPTGARWCQFNAETQAVRWRDDGVAPTATVGMPVATGVTVNYYGDINAIRFIEQTASAKLNVVYYD